MTDHAPINLCPQHGYYYRRDGCSPCSRVAAEPDDYDRWCANARRSSVTMLRRLKRAFGADLGRLSGGGIVASNG